MLKILLNQNEVFIEKKISLFDLLKIHAPSEKNYSIAFNQKFIPREKYQAILLCDGDIIDIIIPMQGG